MFIYKRDNLQWEGIKNEQEQLLEKKARKEKATKKEAIMLIIFSIRRTGLHLNRGPPWCRFCNLPFVIASICSKIVYSVYSIIILTIPV
jgi:hypothetical protein